MTARWLVGHARGRHVLYENGEVVFDDDRALRREMQAQFDGLVAQYPRRTFGHPPVQIIFSSSYARIERPQ